jgi:hypothetical protein
VTSRCDRTGKLRVCGALSVTFSDQLKREPGARHSEARLNADSFSNNDYAVSDE